MKNVFNNPLLGKALYVLPNLMSLDLQYGNQISFSEPRKGTVFGGMQVSDAKSLARALQSMNCLCSLSLTNSQIDDDLVRLFVEKLNKSELSESLNVRDTLIELDLSFNNITTEGLRLITQYFLADNTDGHGNADGNTAILATLKVTSNKIRSEGARTLGRILKTNKSLVTLDMRMNRLEDAGGQLLLDGLCHNSTLKNLNLSSNSLSSLSANALAKVLESAHTTSFSSKKNDDCANELESIDVSSNEFVEKDYMMLASAIQNTSQLVSLDLRGNCHGGVAPSTAIQDALFVISEKLVCNQDSV